MPALPASRRPPGRSSHRCCTVVGTIQLHLKTVWDTRPRPGAFSLFCRSWGGRLSRSLGYPCTMGAVMTFAGCDNPRMITLWMALLSMARCMAWRTRLSLNGFLTLECSRSAARCWPGRARRRCCGSGDLAHFEISGSFSTDPNPGKAGRGGNRSPRTAGAATRVPGWRWSIDDLVDFIGYVLAFHHLGFFTRMSDVRLADLEDVRAVPFSWRTVYFSSLALNPALRRPVLLRTTSST